MTTTISEVYEAQSASIAVKMEKLDGRMTLVVWQLAILIGGVAAPIVKAFA